MNRYSLFSIALILCTWYIASYFTPHYLLPYPHEVLSALTNLLLNKNLLVDIGWTILRVSIGFTIGVLIGVSLGILALMHRLFREIMYPVIAFIVVTPSFTFIPLLMVWIGLNDLLAIVAVIICSSFPITLSLISASKNIDPEIIDVAQTLGADKKTLLLRIILPQAFTHIASIVKLEASHSWRIVFVTEFLALSTGIGAQMMYSYSTIRVDEIIALIITAGLMALLLQYIIEYIETTIMRKWGFIE